MVQRGDSFATGGGVLLLCVLVVTMVFGGCCGDDGAIHQETLFVNGDIYVDADNKVENLLVRDGIVAGHNVDPDDYPDASVVDLKGTAAYPGFNDSHVHLVSMAVAQSILAEGPALQEGGESPRPEEFFEAIRIRCSQVPKGTPVMAHGFVLDDYNAWGLSDLAALDAASGTDHPVMMADQLGHSYIVNSAAMRISGLDVETVEPPGGHIVRDPITGAPTGMLRETAGALVGNVAIFPLVPDEIVREPLVQLLDLWASMGYTSIVELMGGPMGRTMKPGLLRDLEREGQLPLRVSYAYTFTSLKDIEGYKDAGADTDLVHFAGLKLFVDGAAGQGGAWTSWENQLEDTSQRHGLHAVLTEETEGFEEYDIFSIVDRSEELGLDVHYHVGGDLAIQAVLDALASTNGRNGRLNGRHTLYHLGFLTDPQIEEMRLLGEHVIAGIQPSLHWQHEWGNTERYYGPYAQGAYPYQKMFDAGIRLAFSSDFPSNTVQLSWPTEIMRAVLTGGEGLHPNTISMRDLIEGFTVGGFATTRQTDVGTLHVGFKADIVVFEKDLCHVPPDQLSQDSPRVLGTWVGGRRITGAL